MRVMFHCDGCDRAHATADAAGKCERSHPAPKAAPDAPVAPPAEAVTITAGGVSECAHPAWEVDYARQCYRCTACGETRYDERA